jgi:hypothetical protein
MILFRRIRLRAVLRVPLRVGGQPEMSSTTIVLAKPAALCESVENVGSVSSDKPHFPHESDLEQNPATELIPSELTDACHGQGPRLQAAGTFRRPRAWLDAQDGYEIG